MKIVYLEPIASFHDSLRSDTLWGLMCWGIRNVCSEKMLLDFLAAYGDPAGGVKVSSAFPYNAVGSGKELLFPKPFGKPASILSAAGKSTRAELTGDYKRIKDYKGISFLSQSDFFRFLSGNLSEQELFDSAAELAALKPRFRKHERIHNTIDRISGGTPQQGGLYTREVTYAIDSGLFFLMDGDPVWLSVLEGALRFLSHFGFGGDASTGKNHFRVTIEDFVPPQVQNPNGFVTLSLYIPQPHEVTLFRANPDFVWYEIAHRKGKFGGRFIQAARFWTDTVFAFAEGSVFPLTGQPRNGCLVKTPTDDKAAEFIPRRNGIAFDLPMKIAG